MFAAAMLVFAACEGPEGPAGPKGDTGEQGIQGLVGPEGATNCMDCHDNSQLITVKTAEYMESGHYEGAAAGYAGSRSSCSSCHSTQGFMGSALDGTGGPAVSSPLPINCYACHVIHENYDVTDWDLRTSTATVAITGGTTLDMGAGNLCTTCHQSRATAGEFANFEDGGVLEARAGSFRIGMHHGPQYNIFAGAGLYEFTAITQAYPTGNHLSDQTVDGCVDCHMGTDMTDRNHAFGFDEFPASCETCHASGGIARAFDVLETENNAEIAGLIEDLGAELEAAGVIQAGTHYLVVEPDPDGDPGDTRPVMQTEEHLAAAFNYQAVDEDYSMGMHNAPYVRAVLMNTLETVFDYDFSTPVK